MKKETFEGEVILKMWMDCTLTNKRVWKYIENGGRSQYQGFPLNKFQGASVGKVSYPWLMYIGIFFSCLSFLTPFADGGNKFAVFILPFATGCALLAVWHFSKRAQVKMGSTAIDIVIDLHAGKENYDSAISFVSELERAATSSQKSAIAA
ncbi:MAG: hypothetical protein V4736_03695 [Bdellovibrionota bacterium]